MDYSPIVAQVWSMLAWLIPAVLLIGLLKSPWAKGQIGELLVRLFAHWQLDKQTYRRLHNVTLNTPDGTTQIDHVFLSPYGIFVLETKNMSGWIFGSEKQAQWTQKLYKRTVQLPVFSKAEVDAMLHAMQTSRRAPTLATHRTHVQNLKRRSDLTAERQCPRCGNTLLIRTVKSGAKAGQLFWGCSGLPKSRTMQSL
ncbi:nuclease-related domain-containing protein [Ectopseudomonas mendocina]|uniref:NERD domain-containing protein n=1 Tax=Ectopseudomonas mendocina TaxID=300 RepID=A0A2R3QPW2_ECTME|nr:nuclease-related domain-containing protein [Pseudomonas mendocina]AVO53797.1 hypothetical protein C7A17_13790 [Pseudomonas mendocina]